MFIVLIMELQVSLKDGALMLLHEDFDSVHLLPLQCSGIIRCVYNSPLCSVVISIDKI